MPLVLYRTSLLALVLASACAQASLETVPIIYGAPYSVPTPYSSYAVVGAPSVGVAISQWWSKYKSYWGVSGCSYALSLYSETNYRRASMPLGGGCSGGDAVYGTAKCPKGYAISGSVCRLNGTEQPDKDEGTSCNNVGGPINAANGNKNKVQEDYSTDGINPIVIYRTYNSNNDSLYFLGRAWNWNHGRALGKGLVNGNEFISLELDDGNKIRAVFENGRWVTDEDVQVNITKTAVDYQVSYLDDRKDIYNLNGQLVRAELSRDHKISYTYDTQNRPATICNANSQCLVLSYSSQSLVSYVKRNGAVVLHYEYDTQNRLFKVTDKAGGVREYLYEDARFPIALTGIKDENGNRQATYTYDAQGRGISTALAESQNQYLLDYNGDGTTTVTNPLGKQTIYTYETIQGVKKVVAVEGHPSINCAASNKAYVYDTSGLLKSRSDWKGFVTTFEYNARGLEESRTEAFGTPEARTVTTTWHPTLSLRATVTEPARITTYHYDEQGRSTGQTVTER